MFDPKLTDEQRIKEITRLQRAFDDSSFVLVGDDIRLLAGLLDYLAECDDQMARIARGLIRSMTSQMSPDQREAIDRILDLAYCLRSPANREMWVCSDYEVASS